MFKKNTKQRVMVNNTPILHVLINTLHGQKTNSLNPVVERKNMHRSLILKKKIKNCMFFFDSLP